MAKNFLIENNTPLIIITDGNKLNLPVMDKIVGIEDIEITVATKGIILRDTQVTPHKWRVTIDNTGRLTTTDLGVA